MEHCIYDTVCTMFNCGVLRVDEELSCFFLKLLNMVWVD